MIYRQLTSAKSNNKKLNHLFLHTYTQTYSYSFTSKGSTVTTKCDPAAITLCCCNIRTEGGGWIFGERLQFDKSPSGDEKSFLLLAPKRPHCMLTLIYVFSPSLRGGGQVKAHVGP